MPNIDITMDAPGEVTPTFSKHDIAAGSISGRLVAHAVRTSNTSSAVNIALDAVMAVDGGEPLQRHNGSQLEDAWHELNGSAIGLSATEDDELSNNINLYEGLLYRLRYASTGVTNPIRVVVSTPERRA